MSIIIALFGSAWKPFMSYISDTFCNIAVDLMTVLLYIVNLTFIHPLVFFSEIQLVIIHH